jgi:hypothetical protein
VHVRGFDAEVRELNRREQEEHDCVLAEVDAELVAEETASSEAAGLVQAEREAD